MLGHPHGVGHVLPPPRGGFVIDPSFSSILLGLFVIAPPCLPRLVSICCRWFRFAVVVFDSPRLALIRPRWFRVAAVGFLIISPLRLLDTLPLCLVVSPIRLLALPSLPLLVSSLLLVVSTLLHFALAPYSLAFSSLSFALYSGLSPFLLVVVSSPLRRRVAPLHC